MHHTAASSGGPQQPTSGASVDGAAGNTRVLACLAFRAAAAANCAIALLWLAKEISQQTTIVVAAIMPMFLTNWGVFSALVQFAYSTFSTLSRHTGGAAGTSAGTPPEAQAPAASCSAIPATANTNRALFRASLATNAVITAVFWGLWAWDPSTMMPPRSVLRAAGQESFDYPITLCLMQHLLPWLLLSVDLLCYGVVPPLGLVRAQAAQRPPSLRMMGEGRARRDAMPLAVVFVKDCVGQVALQLVQGGVMLAGSFYLGAFPYPFVDELWKTPVLCFMAAVLFLGLTCMLSFLCTAATLVRSVPPLGSDAALAVGGGTRYGRLDDLDQWSVSTTAHTRKRKNGLL
ncbi:hypothetical protein Pelo_14315 [Pelomyxa schiedti]|nr:hypothetical protein Pelo_14315 [Pelomyxa schiedti]